MKTRTGQDTITLSRKALRQEEDRIRQRIADLIASSREDGYASVSKLLGRSHSYVQQYIQRKSPRLLRMADRRRIARYFDIPETELFLSAEVEEAGLAIPRPLETKSEAAAHPPLHGWLESQFGLPASNAFFLTIEGDNMAPSLLPGDEVMVEPGICNIEDGVYALRIGGKACARRITLHPADGTLVISCDNEQYAAFEGVQRENIVILGRIIWLARRLT